MTTTEQHNNDCLLGQGTYTYTPICQCNTCFVDPTDEPDEYEQHRSGQANSEPFEDDYFPSFEGHNDGPSDEEIETLHHDSGYPKEVIIDIIGAPF